jgi:hypothetical protein
VWGMFDFLHFLSVRKTEGKEQVGG